MRIVATLLTLLATSSSARRVTCHACINKVCYGRDTILKSFKFSGQLAIDRNSNIVYFHYKNKQTKDHTGGFDLDEVKFKVIPNLGFTFGHAVDQSTRDLYMSGVTGVYRHNPERNATELYGLRDKTVWHLQYSDKLYYSEFQGKGIYAYINKTPVEITGTTSYEIDDFIIDKQNDTYFMSNYAIYLLKNSAKKAEMFENENYSLTTDKNGEAYFAQSYTRGIYKVNYRTGKLAEVGAFTGTAVKFVFDSDNNIIYYDERDRSLYYLSPTLNKCTVTTKGIGRKSRKFVALVNGYKAGSVRRAETADRFKKDNNTNESSTTRETTTETVKYQKH